MSISNNIAEGSGSFSDKEFAKLSEYFDDGQIFECANILIHLRKKESIICQYQKEPRCILRLITT